MHFSSLTPVYIQVGPPGHRKKVLNSFKSSKAKGVVTVNDSYSDSSQSGTQTADGPPVIGRLTLGSYSPFGCAYAHYNWAAGFTIDTHSSGSWPTPPDGGVEIDAGSPTHATPANLHLTGSATVTWYLGGGGPPGSGYFLTEGPVGTPGQWEQEFSNVLRDSGQPDATAYVQWAFEPNKPKKL